MTIAREISHRIKYELGVTVSIGISWNKIYAKLGSDYKKPDAITEFNRENYKDRIWQASSVRFAFMSEGRISGTDKVYWQQYNDTQRSGK